MRLRPKSVGLAIALTGLCPLASVVLLLNLQSRVYAQTQTVLSAAEQQPESIQRLLETAKQFYRKAEFKQAIATYQQIWVDPDAGVAAKITALAELGHIYLWIDQLPKAEEVLQQALKWARESGDRLQEADVLALLSVVDRNRQDYAKALDGLNQALKLSQATGSRNGETRARFLTGTVSYYQGQYAKALEAFQTALGMAQADRDQDQLTYIYDWMAIAYRELKDTKQAETMSQQQQRLSREIGHRTAEYDGLWTVASLKQQPEQVLQAYQTQLAIAQAADNPWFQRSALVAIGGFYAQQKQASQAVEMYQKALDVAKTLDAAAVAETQYQIGGAYYQAKQYANAVAAYQQALKFYQAQNDREKVAQTLLDLGASYDNQEQYSQARKIFQQAKTIAQQIPNRATELRAIFRYGLTYIGQGNSLSRATAYNEAIAAFEQAVDPWQQTQSLARELKDTQLEQSAIRQLLLIYTGKGLAFDQLRQYAEAVSAFQQGLTVWRQYRDRLPEEEFLKEEMSSLGTLGYSYINNGEYEKALASGQQALHIAEQLGDLTKQVSLLKMIAGTYNYLGEYPQALTASQQALTLIREKLKQHPEIEMGALITTGQVLKRIGKYQMALVHYEQALTIAKNLKNIQSEIAILNNVGNIYSEQGEYLQALEALQKSQNITQDALQKLQSKDMKAIDELCDVSQKACLQILEVGSISIFNNLGYVHHKLGRYSDALDTYQKSLNIAQKYKDLDAQTTLFNNIGSIYLDRGDYSTAKNRFQESLKLAIAANAQPHKFSALINIGIVYDEQGKPSEALEQVQQALTLAQAMQSPDMEATALNNLGNIYQAKGDYNQASQFYQKSLAIRRQHGLSLTTILNNIANLDLDQGRYAQAIDQLQQAIDIAEKTGDYNAKVTLIRNLGSAYQHQSLYAEALKFYQQAQALSQKMGSRSSELTDLLSQGRLYRDLGQYSQARERFEQALSLSRKLGKKGTEATALIYMGDLHFKQEQYAKALQHYQQALKISQEVGDLVSENRVLQSIARIHEKQGNSNKAVELLQEVLKVQRQVGVRPDEAITLSALGRAYTTLGNVSAAQEALRQALVITQDINNPEIEAKALSHLGALFAKQNQPELAIVFYKRSVNLTERIRDNLRSLPREQQESYTQMVTGTYRSLADLLIQQRRLPEAQAVLELLKLHELQDFTRDAGINSDGISLAKIEETALKQILKQFTTLGNFAQTMADCEQKQCPTLNQLEQQRDRLYLAVNQELDQQRAILAKYFATEPTTLLSDKLNVEARNIVTAQPGTVLIYPLILKDKIQFLLALKTGEGAITFRPFEAKITADKLFATIHTFRNQLKNPGDLKQLQSTSQELYNALIKPLEPELNNPQIKHLVFAPDSITRYIPLAALYNGKQYLIQRYSISTITAASKTDTTDTTPKPIANQSLLLATGASIFSHLPALDSVPLELDAITQTSQHPDHQGIYPGKELLNSSFDYDTLKANLKTGHYRILHIATHGAFKPGRPENSYLVPGRGENLTTQLIDALGNYGLRKIHLVVLSACETAVGDRASDGIEIPGISYFFLKNEVKSVLASLWSVNDASTALIMQQFYQHIATGMTKAEALQIVQQDLINSKLTAKDAPKRSADIEVTGQAGTRSPQSATNFSHPYYWAPFILIGNSL